MNAGIEIANIVSSVTKAAIDAGWATTEEEIATIGKMALQNIMDTNEALYAAYAEEVFATAAA